MVHPQMFDDDDPLLARVRELCLAFPEAYEKIAHGRPCFHSRAMFAVYGGSVKNAVPGGPMERHPRALLVKVPAEDREALAQDPRFFHPAYLGPHGWAGLDLDGPPTDPQELAELVDASYREVCGPRLVRLLDEQGSPAAGGGA
ncbi:MmcQ/YjbR family DNA-binding protein [Cellulomonas sp. PhB143]|uniref:MmcQ/YjbR family DNA-binding protein n=1 Tax=Cellulomonas sp. PhB143 TaxID=2485186 RepID=UPI000F48CEAF|nr:MmcQ/YjbR family DNA-binding protein [Cellulomonas sp. PhB143]ROS79114.1 YjbR protein [Cellulomonas sp. PhB143]